MKNFVCQGAQTDSTASANIQTQFKFIAEEWKVSPRLLSVFHVWEDM